MDIHSHKKYILYFILGGSPPLSITGLSRVSSLITGVIIHLLTGMNHQVGFIVLIWVCLKI